MFFKKSLKKLEKEIKPYLEEKDYFYAGFIAENSGYKELANKYYEISRGKLKEDIFLGKLKEEETSPSIRCHMNLIKKTDFMFPGEYKEYFFVPPTHIRYGNLVRRSSNN
jgi:hypothetical protein